MKAIDLDHNGLNMAISGSMLPDREMRELGFTDHDPAHWYYVSRVGAGITFNVTLPKNGSRLKIDVIDEDFLQPYDYQEVLRRNPGFEFALKVKSAVEKQMEKFANVGIITGYTPGMYI